MKISLFSHIKLSSVLLLSLLLCASPSIFAAEPINTLEKSGLFSFKPSGIAIRGADTVAYFTENKFVAGSDAFTTQWQGATWKFASQQHLDLFVAEPEKYAPQYGGYCAYGVAQNYLVKIEPENWTIIDGKLYLNYSSGVHKKWQKDTQGFISKANNQFQALLNE